MDIFDKLHSMSFEDRVEYARKLAEKYGYDLDSEVIDDDTDDDGKISYANDEKKMDADMIEQIAYQLTKDKEPITLEDAQDILLLCLFE